MAPPRTATAGWSRAQKQGLDEGPALLGQDGGRYWIRTSDLADVNRAL